VSEASSVQPDFRIAVATPHQEASMLAIARGAARHGQLERMYTTFHTGGLRAAVEHVPAPALRRRLGAQLARRGFPGIEPGVVQGVAQLPQAMQVLSMRIPRAHSVASWLLYDSKKRFDRAVARRVSGERVDAVVALDFSAAATFQALRGSGVSRILSFIDSHPRYQNRYLREFCGLHDPHRELVFPDVIGRIENELEFAELVIVPSSFVARQLDAVGVPAERVVVEPLAVDVSAFHPAPSGQRAHQRGPFRCLFVGQLSYRKGLTFLLEAARRLRHLPVEFQLVGPVISPEVVRGMPENVSWRGARLREGVAGAMREADFFILPSVEDAFGLVALEAMASGVPPIVTEHVGAGELISNRRDGFVIPVGDPTAIVELVEELVEADELRLAVGQAARRRVERGCSWQDYEERVLRLLRQRVTEPTLSDRTVP
jgi:glycosyltransferase involved in cell wall biosynthesis